MEPGNMAAQMLYRARLQYRRTVDFEGLQPKRLKPQEVKAKNAAGCLSPADAIYGADGCPLKLCPNPQWQGL